jgi:Rieske 2Fe-2S family protein
MSAFRKATEIGTGGARTLPGLSYTSEAVYRQEQERIFARRWVCVGRADELPIPGAFIVRESAGESLIILRDRSDVVRAFFNVCRHRGTRLCSEERGRFSQTIQCPYHAWTYALDGGLIGAPCMEGSSAFAKDDFPLHAANVEVWEGFVFVNLAESPDPFDVAFAPLIDKFARYRLPTLRTERRASYDVAANWKLIFENYSECYHCATVHPQLVKLSPSDSGENDLTSGPFLGGYMTIPKADGLSTTGRACAIPVGELPAEDLRRVYYYSIFPNMLLSLHADYVMVHLLRPVSPVRTTIECLWLFHPQASSRPDFEPDAGVAFWDETNRQDWRMCELNQLGVGSRAYGPSPYSPRESISAAFDREYLDAIAERHST